MNIGLTGSIASGKSTVAKIFEILGFNVFYADNEAKLLYYQKEIMDEIIKVTNLNFTDNTGNPDFKKISDFVFSNKKNNTTITGILYPHVIKRFFNWTEDYKSSEICIMEAAMLFEGNVDEYMDKTICVHADENIRLERIRKRNYQNPEDFLKRIDFQMSDIEKIKRADFTIYNNGDKSLLKQVISILEYLK